MISASAFRYCYAAFLLLVGLCLGWVGTELIFAGGSSYYLVAGLCIAASGALFASRPLRAAQLYGLFLAGTYLWAFWEAGLDGWALAPRLIAPTVLGLAFLPALRVPSIRRMGRPVAFLALLAGIFVVLLIVRPAPTQSSGHRTVAAQDDDWLSWGRDQAGTRFSPLAQITPENVGKLRLAWVFRTGNKEPASPFAATPFEATPLKVGPMLYLCSPNNDVFALDADSGKVRWRFHARADRTGVSFAVCRGVAYYRDPDATSGPCVGRIYTTSIDARLLALDAQTGRPCPNFGRGGVVDLRKGMGPMEKGYYYVTSAPQIIRGKIVFGGWVSDNQHVNEPSGVIRAYDAVTGRFAWAFDAGQPDKHSEPGPGENYTLGTPNSWAPLSADENLGLVYVPTGNATPDWFGGQRRPFDDRFSSSVIALDAQTGAVRWSFQTTHHDLWDYDVASQPTLYDLPVAGGRRVPALIQPTKRGQIFVLDRRTGKPLTPVVERAVPPSDVPGERSAPTQPFSVGMPDFAGPTLTEKMMWGLTPLDQAWCRLQFRRSNYRGSLTPVTVGRPTIVYPSYVGGSDWGGVSIDKDRDILIGNSNRIAMRSELIPRRQADAMGIRPLTANAHSTVGSAGAQAGTPYAVSITPFLSPLGVPCQQPPFGMLSAIDMKTRKLVWSQPFGTAHDSGPLGLESRLPIRMGVPNTGGSVLTRSGLTFIAATQDRYLRAFETATGRLLWQARLPAGGQATPMTYGANGRQFVVISAGGSKALATKPGDYVLAYALPVP